MRENDSEIRERLWPFVPRLSSIAANAVHCTVVETLRRLRKCRHAEKAKGGFLRDGASEMRKQATFGDKQQKRPAPFLLASRDLVPFFIPSA